MGLVDGSQAVDVAMSLSSLHAIAAGPRAQDAPAPPSPNAVGDGRFLGAPTATAANDTVSFRAVFDAHYDYVCLSLRRLGVHDRDRDDVTNEVFFRVHGRLDTYDTTRPMRPWLFAFAVRAASDYRKLARHRRETGAPEHGIASMHPGPMPDEQAIRREEQRLVARALDTLDLPLRSVFVMHELDQVPVPTIAEALGIPLGTAYTRLRSARQDFTIAVRRLSAKGKEAIR